MSDQHTDKIICEHCNQRIIPDEFNFCHHCGERIEGPFNYDLDCYLNVTEDNKSVQESSIPTIEFCDKCGFSSMAFAKEFQYCYMCGNHYGGKTDQKNIIEDIMGLPIYLGRYEHILDDDEICLYSQEDAEWSGYTENIRDQMYLETSLDVGSVRFTSASHIDDGLPDEIFDVIAEGTLYLTNKRVILYDQGYSNIWTRLSASGDFPEQVQYIWLDDIKDAYGPAGVGNGDGVVIYTRYGEVNLGHSHRKYKGRKTPMQTEFGAFKTFLEKISTLIQLP